MVNIFEKIRYSIFGERSITSICDKIVKDKKLDDNTKFCTILDKYCEYYVTKKFDRDVVEETYEIYFEKFMVTNTVRHELKFKSYINKVERETNYFIAVSIVKQVKALKDINEDNLTVKQKNLLSTIKLLAENIYTQNFDYERMYYDFDFAKRLDEKNKILIDLIKDYDAEKYLKPSEEMDLFN